jgi:hypothetical protein
MLKDVGEPPRSISDVKAHVVRYGDCSMLLWLDRVGHQIQGILLSDDAIDDTLKALARWSRYLEPSWRAHAD